MNPEQLRRAVKAEWLTYYQDNRHWLTRLAVWVTCQGQRRPTSSFILAALSTLNPKLPQLLPLIVELNNDPDRIIAALGLNFNPEDELQALTGTQTAEVDSTNLQILPSQPPRVPPIPSRLISQVDAACSGRRDPDASPRP